MIDPLTRFIAIFGDFLLAIVTFHLGMKIGEKIENRGRKK